ncbi:hypothetical protein RN001_014041 [Aquatica leii]|uniref:Bee-milk protein n=1 Tax=Aquatica leii TaxID=1421715 RepID=A0AAN7S7B7_9COLE|nr:hypothetical protein RN001_014041 [Aquatica leii]
MKSGFVCFVLSVQLVVASVPLIHPVFEWINTEFDYPSLEARQDAINSGEFIERVSRPSDIDVYYDENEEPKYFLTFPRTGRGTPVTLGTMTDKILNDSPVIAPYPSWEWHQNLNQCSQKRIVSVFRIKIDECQRLWVLDTGVIIGTPLRCPPQILAFDLKTNTLIHQYEIPASQVQSTSVFNLPVVDVRDSKTCKGTFVYAADTRGFGLIVHDVDNKASWRITDKTMHANSDFGTLCIDGSRYEIMDGIQGMALSPHQKEKDRVLFYHALASNSEQYVWTSQIRNRTAFLTTTSPNPDIFHMYCGRRDTQSFPMVINKHGIAYFGLSDYTSFNCWNTRAPYRKRNIHELYKNPVTLQYINGLKLITRRNGDEEIWLINSRLRRVVSGPSNSTEINFRVQMGEVKAFEDKCYQSWSSMECVGEFNNCRSCYNCVVND